MSRLNRISLWAISLLMVLAASAQAQETNLTELEKAIDHLMAPIQADKPSPVTYKISGVSESKDKAGNLKKDPFKAMISAADSAHFRLMAQAGQIQVDLQRTPQATWIHRLDKSTLFINTDAATLPDEQQFKLSNLVKSIASLNPMMAQWVGTVEAMNGKASVALAGAVGLLIERGPETPASVTFIVTGDKRPTLNITIDKASGHLKTLLVKNLDGTSLTLDFQQTGKADLLAAPPEKVTNRVTVSKGELDRSLLMGLTRVAEIQFDSSFGPRLQPITINGEHGVYAVRDGQRIMRLKGKPYEIGLQHGKFVGREMRKIVSSTLYVVGMVYSLESGKWFLDEIRTAATRLDKFTPEEFKQELKGIADGGKIPFEEIRLANYFPALFHCSGFTLKGDVTEGGKLFHGRILDYMTHVGLQDNAVLFIVEKEGKIPFVNVGYAGFYGSVTGMNAKKISLGEMGGRGEGNWDGIEMPILMRMALENANTLQEAKDIFSKNPRTCEYYYVFADGKDRSSVGVYATPENIGFVEPGAAHEKLPTPVLDCVLLSAGDRYTRLCSLVKDRSRKLSVQDAIRLMDAPVAMGDSNLHSVLMVPEDLEIWVSHAGRKGAAWKEKFHRYNLNELLSEGFFKLAQSR